jgi:SEC-C motif
MALAGRNARCPCGSGLKYKKCCGLDRASERALEDRLMAVEEIARLAFRSPRLVPLCDAYDVWVRGVLAGELDANTDEAIATLDADEARRIVESCLALYPAEWSALVARCQSERDALAALLGGAVAAGIRDHRSPEPADLELVDSSDDLAGDPFEALALCLDGGQLWEPAEGREAERAIDAIPDWVDDDVYESRWQGALDDIAARCTTDWHRRRLARLVVRIGEQLPYEGFPRASTAIRAGYEQFAADEAFGLRLAATLLGDMVGRDQLRELRALFAA